MIWLRNKDNGNIYPVLEQSAEYQYLRLIKSIQDGRPLYEELGLQEVTADQPNLPFANFVIAKYFNAVTNAGDTVNNSLGLAPQDGTLTAAVLVVNTTQAGQATNFRTLTIFDDGTPANAGAAYAQVVPVNMASLVFNAATVQAVAGQETALTVGTPAVNSNDILRFASVPSGTGLAFVDGVVLATFTKKV